jgi:hypothetical protein
LAEQTGNETYKTAAISAANFGLMHLYDSQSQLMITDFTLGNSSKPCSVDPTQPKRPYQHGGFMEALSVLSDVTHDPKWSNM